MDRVLCGMSWSRCLVYLNDVISLSGTVPEALARLEEVLGRLSNLRLQLKVKKCTFMQTEGVFLGHIVGRTSLACDPAKLSAVRNWHAPDKVKGVRQFVGFVGYYRRFVKDFADLAEPLVALTRKGAPFVWTDCQQKAFEELKACLINAPILGFPTEHGREPLRSWGGGGLEPAPGRLRGGDCVCQPSYPLGDVGRGRDVYTFSVILVRDSVYPSYRRQLPPMAAEIPE